MPRRRSKKRRNPKGIVKLFHDVHRTIVREGNASLVPATFIAVGLLDLIPIPTDIGYFYVQRWLDQNKDELTPFQRSAAKYFNYYGWDFTFYTSVGLITYYGGKSVREKLVLGAGVLSAGAVATLLWKLSRGSKHKDLVCKEIDEGDQEAS